MCSGPQSAGRTPAGGGADPPSRARHRGVATRRWQIFPAPAGGARTSPSPTWRSAPRRAASASRSGGNAGCQVRVPRHRRRADLRDDRYRGRPAGSQDSRGPRRRIPIRLRPKASPRVGVNRVLSGLGFTPAGASGVGRRTLNGITSRVHCADGGPPERGRAHPTPARATGRPTKRRRSHRRRAPRGRSGAQAATRGVLAAIAQARASAMARGRAAPAARNGRAAVP